MTLINSEYKTQPTSNILWLLTMFYVMVLVLANWFDPRLISIFGMDTDAGTLIFPLTFLLADLITEVYGYKYARRAIWLGLAFNLLFIGYGQLIMHMPSPAYATKNEMFDTIFAANFRIILASITSYLCAEPLNSFIMAKLKIRFAGAYLGLRFIVSTVFASALDSCIFGCLAFYGDIPNPELSQLIINMWIFKVMIECAMLPFSTRLARKFKQLENLDRYDIGTQFNLFSIDASYTAEQNKFAATHS